MLTVGRGRDQILDVAESLKMKPGHRLKLSLALKNAREAGSKRKESAKAAPDEVILPPGKKVR